MMRRIVILQGADLNFKLAGWYIGLSFCSLIALEGADLNGGDSSKQYIISRESSSNDFE